MEDEEGRYEPINYASSLAEGFEMAKDDLRLRMKNLESDKDPGLSPCVYKLWARGLDGHRIAATWKVSEL